MRAHRWTVVAATLVLLAAAGAAPPPEGAEPPQLFTLEVDGAEVAVHVDKPFAVEIGGRSVPMTLRVASHRVFEAAGITFHYPRHFTFEYEKDWAATLWTLEGPTTVLIISRVPRQDAAAAVRETAATSMAALGVARSEEVELETGVGRLKGRGFKASIAGAALRQDVYAFDAGESTCLLMIQDVLEDDGSASPATREAVALLAKTLALAGK